MAGVPTRIFEDVIFYGFLLGAGALFIVGSSLFIPEFRDNRNQGFLSGIQNQINAITKKINSPVQTVKAVTPTAPKGTNNCKKVAGYSIWRGTGCLNGKQLAGLEFATLGTCEHARDGFINKYRC